jgi:hypothetical protein
MASQSDGYSFRPPFAPRRMGQGGKLSVGRRKEHPWQQIESRSTACHFAEIDPPSILAYQGGKLALLVVFSEVALFPEPSEPAPEIGKEHLSRLAKGHLIRQS